MKFSVPLEELEFTFVRSSGPGGQNVNKVNSKAQLRWNLVNSPSLSEWDKPILLQKLANQLTKEGEVLISSDVFRDQNRNRENCIEKLQALVNAALKENKARKKTKPTWSSKKRNETSKKKQSEKKKFRKGDY